MPKADGMECTADLTEEQHRPDQSALETVPSLRQEATSPPHVEADDMEWDAARTYRPQEQATHAPAKAFAPPLGAPTPPCLGDDDETEPESDMDEDDAPVSLSRSKAAKAEATQDRAPTRYSKLQALHARMKARKAAAKQKRDASAQSEGEQMEDGEAEPQQACQLWLLMELVRELQTPTQNATTTQETSHSRETEEEQTQMEVTETAVI